MPSRQYCLKVNRIHSCNWRPELVKCSQWQPCGVVTQQRMTQILSHPKLLKKLNGPHICRNWTLLGIPNFRSFHVGSKHHMAVTGYNELILVNNLKTEFRSSSSNNISRACWQKKVLPQQVIFKTFSKFSYRNTGTKVRLNSLLYLLISDSWHFINNNPKP